MNFIPQGKPEYVRILARYPQKVRDQWSYTRKFDNPLFEEKGDAKVVAYESVTVPAGTFDCFRVEIKASFSYKAYQQRNSWSRWYCPAVKTIAKQRRETYILTRLRIPPLLVLPLFVLLGGCATRPINPPIT